MGDGTKENPYTREDVERLIKENGGKAEGLDLSGKIFIEPIDLSGLYLTSINLTNTRLFRADFRGSVLDGANLQKTYLGYANFEALGTIVTSLQSTDFRMANLHDAKFKDANLSCAQFQETEVLGIVSPPQFQGKILELLPASLDRTDFRGANLFRTNFKGCYFYGTKFEGVSISGADIFEAHLEGANWGRKYILGEENKRDYSTAEHYYRRLKVWYKQAGYDDISAKFYYREKEAERKGLKFFSGSWFNRITWQFSFWVFGHGEGWKRILLWIAGFVLVFAFIYFSLGYLTPNSFLDCLYYSAVSFIALGYGAWVREPVGLVRILGVVETFLGFFMMTLLLVTFVRKRAR